MVEAVAEARALILQLEELVALVVEEAVELLLVPMELVPLVLVTPMVEIMVVQVLTVQPLEEMLEQTLVEAEEDILVLVDLAL